MATVISRVLVVAVLFTFTTVAGGQLNQAPTSQSPPQPIPATKLPKVQGAQTPWQMKAPDMVCFGSNPDWSIEFSNREARYVGANQPDKYFLGEFYWLPQENAWSWHRQDGLAPTTGEYGLSAHIQKTACQDTARNRNFPYWAQVNLAQGDMVTGCCRKLKPGEAPVGPHGVPTATPRSRVR